MSEIFQIFDCCDLFFICFYKFYCRISIKLQQCFIQYKSQYNIKMKHEHSPHQHVYKKSRYDIDQGFLDEEDQPTVVIHSQQQPNTNISARLLAKQGRKSTIIKQPKAKLKFLSISKLNDKNISQAIYEKQAGNKRSVSKSLELGSRSVRNLNDGYSSLQPMFKSNRTLIGENLSIPQYALQDSKALKSIIILSNSKLVFQAPQQANTHGLLRKFLLYKKNSLQKSFIDHKYNYLLKQRIKQSFIMPKSIKINRQNNNDLLFYNEIQSGNLQMVGQVSDNQYDLYLKNDTNTHGHQNWFYFSVKNANQTHKSIKINICNVKRDFRMIARGQKIFTRFRKLINQQNCENLQYSPWYTNGSNFCIKQNTNPKIARGRIFKLSFTIKLQAMRQYQISMLPAYTYSKMLSFIEQIETKNKRYVDIDLLCYSLMGLAIPIMTVTNKDVSSTEKKIILVNCRIHPGETNASYVLEGFLQKLLSINEPKQKGKFSQCFHQLLNTVIFKIVPMINPDGVVFGNFRTSKIFIEFIDFLGVDMNRSFYTQDEILNPEIFSLKQLGRKLKSSYGNKFIYFLDLHGHSSDKNIFTYGPNFDITDPNYYNAKALPRVLDHLSKYFNYQGCSFVLQEHKNDTARGFFLRQTNTMTYTIESSYALYDDYADSNSNSIEKLFQVKDWMKFGEDLIESLDITLKIIKAHKFKSHRQLKKIISQRQDIKNREIDKAKREQKKQKHKSNYLPKRGEQFFVSDSDGESQQQDLTQEQRKQIQKNVQQSSVPSFSLPKVLKPSIVYPTVTPKLFEINQQKQEVCAFKYLFTKRNKFNNIKIINNNSLQSNHNYLPFIQQLERLKPNIKNIQIDKKKKNISFTHI